MQKFKRKDFAATEEWLAERNNSVGGSEIATLFSASYQTPLDLYLLKRGEVTPEFSSSQKIAMQIGHDLENTVANLFAELTEFTIDETTKSDFIVESVHNPLLQVSPDRFYTDNNGNLGCLECKTTAKRIDPDDIPQRWYLQLQYQLHVTGFESGAIAWIETNYSHTFNLKFFKRNTQIGAEIERRVVAFMKNVKDGIPPEPTTERECDFLFAQSEETAVEANDSIADEIANIVRRNDEIKQLETANEISREAIKKFMQTAEKLTYKGDTLCTWKSTKPTERFDSKRFKADNAELYAQYITKGASQRRFLIK